MSTPKDNFESRLSRVFGGLEKSTTSNPLAEKVKPQQDSSGIKGGDKPWLPARWDRTTPPRLDSPESDDGIDANDDDGEVVEKKTYTHAVPPQLVPDHVQNPQKWKKYDLTEENLEETEFKGLQGEQLNKRVAFQFLGDLRKRKGLEQGIRLDDDDDDSEGKVVFQRPKLPPSQPPAAAAARAGTGVVTMPQYEFGSRPPTQKRAKMIPVSAFKSPELHGSDESDEEAEEDDEGVYKGVGVKPIIELPHLDNGEEDSDDDDDDEGTGDLKIYDVGSDDSNGPRDDPCPRGDEEKESSEGEDA